ncbi:LacI family DNA-binding transcriptional regulator [Herbiconiux sp. KACC 21604]|uniref:LacI family DNA-binding transcriptional regulator n=1 Tax=unclassified Herbiconiux TaxID=2618217 RepID=UPI0014928161|nr:LacI family DNA-binding transcriptional regulator [Herbiconiux sp. SALV-R1]QJU53347.1 LacI family DNA-binding transcriptional regulator [Herbiconiux sp. SALV-R1]WPO88309.1 LacI family DNA-binding transcriptional regulator [Herbiconiux sp. KACC 21604]
MNRPRIPRQSDIARLAGVSQATVSMVLNDRAGANRIPETTQERIREAMTELGYVPNIAAQSLRGGRSGLIGVHTFERVFPTAPDDYYREFLNGIEERAVESGLDLVLFASTQKPDGTRSIYGSGSNRMRLADGAIILGFETNDDEIARLADEGFPFVFIGHREVPGVTIPYVTADYAAAMAPVVRMLASAGHRRVTYLAAPLRGFAQRERLEGFEHAAGGELDEVVVEVRELAEVTAEWARGQLAAGSTAVVVETFDLARALRAALDEAGLSAPADLSVVSLDSDPRGEGPFSHLRVPRREMGRRAVELLLAVIDGAQGSSLAEPVHCAPPAGDTVAAPRVHEPAAAHTP